MDATQIISAIKSQDKSGRQNLKRLLVTDPDAWNGINGTGSIPENLPVGRIIGLVKTEVTLIEEANVVAQQGANVIGSASTNSWGYYSLDLAPGQYELHITKEGYYETIISNLNVVSGMDLTVNVEMTLSS